MPRLAIIDVTTRHSPYGWLTKIVFAIHDFYTARLLLPHVIQVLAMASYVLPHTPTHSPTRPVSSYSTRSTIRRVTPSPESLSEALSQGFAKQSTPRHSVHSLGHLPAYKHISGRGKIQIQHQNETRYPG